jgi:hypothetical protein
MHTPAGLPHSVAQGINGTAPMPSGFHDLAPYSQRTDPVTTAPAASLTAHMVASPTLRADYSTVPPAESTT